MQLHICSCFTSLGGDATLHGCTLGVTTCSRRLPIPGSSPTVRRRQLGMELRRLREAAHKTQDEAAAYLEIDSTVVSDMSRARCASACGSCARTCSSTGSARPGRTTFSLWVQ